MNNGEWIGLDPTSGPLERKDERSRGFLLGDPSHGFDVCGMHQEERAAE